MFSLKQGVITKPSVKMNEKTRRNRCQPRNLLKVRGHREMRGKRGVLFVDLRDQLAVWMAFQFVRVELEIVGLRTVIAEVRIAVQKLLDVSGDECAHGHTGMSFDRRLPNRGRAGHLVRRKPKTPLNYAAESTIACCADCGVGSFCTGPVLFVACLILLSSRGDW